MLRIHVTGNSGAGKTSFAAALAEKVDLPVYGLDHVVWQSGWIKNPYDVRCAKENELAAQERWIIEGVSKRIRAYADCTIFLDVPKHIAFYRAFRRNLRFLFRGRPELPDDCPEIKAIWSNAKLINQFQSETRPRIVADLNQCTARTFIVRSDEERAACLKEVTALVQAAQSG